MAVDEAGDSALLAKINALQKTVDKLSLKGKGKETVRTTPGLHKPSDLRESVMTPGSSRKRSHQSIADSPSSSHAEQHQRCAEEEEERKRYPRRRRLNAQSFVFKGVRASEEVCNERTSTCKLR